MLARELPPVPKNSTTTLPAAAHVEPQNAIEPPQRSESTLSDRGTTSSELAGTDPANMAEGFKAAIHAVESAAAAYEKVRRLDEEYSVSSRISAASSTAGTAALSAVQKAQAIEEEYHVSEKVVSSVQAAVSTASKAEEDYRISERLASAAREASRLAAE